MFQCEGLCGLTVPLQLVTSSFISTWGLYERKVSEPSDPRHEDTNLVRLFLALASGCGGRLTSSVLPWNDVN